MSNEALKMSQLGDKYLIRFYQLGLSSVDPGAVVTYNAAASPERLRQCCRKFHRRLLPSLCFLVVMMTASVLSFYNLKFKKINFDNTIYCVFITCAFATCAMTLQRTPLFSNRSHYLWMALTNYEHFICQRLKVKIAFDAFRRKFNWCVRILVYLFLAMLLAKIVYRIDVDNYIRQIAALVLICVTMLVTFQILFYVNLFASMIELLNQHMVDARGAIECDTSAERSRKFTATLKNYKLIHYKLYEISQLINENFGWILVSLIMQNANNTVQPLYWVIVNLHTDNIPSNLRILSKYLLNNYSIRTSIYLFVSIYFDEKNRLSRTKCSNVALNLLECDENTHLISHTPHCNQWVSQSDSLIVHSKRFATQMWRIVWKRNDTSG